MGQPQLVELNIPSMEKKMIVSYAAILVAGLTPLVCAGIAKAGAKSYDNRDPRAWMAQQTGYRARANAAQANSLEAFPFLQSVWCWPC